MIAIWLVTVLCAEIYVVKENHMKGQIRPYVRALAKAGKIQYFDEWNDSNLGLIPGNLF